MLVANNLHHNETVGEGVSKWVKWGGGKKIMVIGSGPIIIGQAAEFDYAGTQACLALKEEGYSVVLVNLSILLDSPSRAVFYY